MLVERGGGSFPSKAKATTAPAAAVMTRESGKLFGRRTLRRQLRHRRPTAAKCSETAAITICVQKARKPVFFNDNPNDCANCSDRSGGSAPRGPGRDQPRKEMTPR
jgi:hypothetical protein